MCCSSDCLMERLEKIGMLKVMTNQQKLKRKTSLREEGTIFADNLEKELGQ